MGSLPENLDAWRKWTSILHVLANVGVEGGLLILVFGFVFGDLRTRPLGVEGGIFCLIVGGCSLLLGLVLHWRAASRDIELERLKDFE